MPNSEAIIKFPQAGRRREAPPSFFTLPPSISSGRSRAPDSPPMFNGARTLNLRAHRDCLSVLPPDRNRSDQ